MTLKLRTALSQHMGEVVRVGIRSGFIYIHDCDDTTIDEIGAMDPKLMAQNESELRAMIARRDNTIYNFKKRRTTARRLKKNGWISPDNGKKLKDSSIKEFERVLSMTKEQCKEYTDKVYEEVGKEIEQMNDYILRYVPILERHVKEIYKSDFNDDTIIVVEGREIGRYWTKREYETKNWKYEEEE